MDERRLIHRAISAYYQNPKYDEDPDPSHKMSALEMNEDGKHYVILRSEDRKILAVYRLKPDGFLRELKRWPSALREEKEKDK